MNEVSGLGGSWRWVTGWRTCEGARARTAQKVTPGKRKRDRNLTLQRESIDLFDLPICEWVSKNVVRTMILLVHEERWSGITNGNVENTFLDLSFGE